MTGSLNAPAVFRILVCLLLTSTIFVVTVSAAIDSNTIPVSTAPLAKDSPDLISSLKIHIAYVGQTQQARMDGVITYLDTISGGNRTSDLQNIENDYMDTVTSVPLMQTSDEIAEAREELRIQSQLFSETTKKKIITFNGSVDAMRVSISASENAVDSSYASMKDSLWLTNESARLMIFNQESHQRSVLLTNLVNKGINVSGAQNISDQIDGKRPLIEKALAENSASSLKTVNSSLKTMNRQIRASISEYNNAMEIQMKRAAILSTID